MKYDLLGILGALTAGLGVAATAQAHIKIDRLHNHAIRWANVSTTTSSQIAHNPPAPAVSMNRLELAVFDRINQYRQSHNLRPLGIDPLISERAKAHSLQMARTSHLVHSEDSLDRQHTYVSIAENISTCRGYAAPESIAIQDWIASPPHHRNIVGRFNLTGVGVTQNAKGEYYFTQIFIFKQK